MEYIWRFRSRRWIRHSCRGVLLAALLPALSACASFPMAPANATYRTPDGSRTAQLTGGAILIDEQKQRTVYEGITRTGVVFSPKGGRDAYLAVREGKVLPIIDGIERGTFDTYPVEKPLSFSSTGELAAFVGIRGGKWIVQVNGNDSQPYDQVGASSPVFSPDGSHFSYSAANGDKWRVVTDGEEGMPYDGILAGTPVYSPDSAHVSYGVRIGEKWRLVTDELEGVLYDGLLVGSPHFSPDSSRMAFGAQEGGSWKVIAGDQVSESYEQLMDVGFAAPNWLIYVGKTGGAWSVYADGSDDATYEGILKPGLIFSNDRSRFAYVGMLAGRMTAVVDGVATDQSYRRIGIYDTNVDAGAVLGTVLANLAINALTVPLGVAVISVPKNLLTVSEVRSIRFSADGQHYAYFATDEDRCVIVVDGVEQRTFPAGTTVEALEFDGVDARPRVRLAGSGTWESVSLPKPPADALESPGFEVESRQDAEIEPSESPLPP